MNSAWRYSTIYQSVCQLIEEQTLWGQVICRVWLPDRDAVVKVPAVDLQDLSHDINHENESNRIAYVAAATKVAEVLENGANTADGHVLLAPMESNVIPLPHQIHTLSRAISGDRVRYMLADEVGLGKTIEAGLIIRELKLRGLVRRVLVITPKGIATQWVAEMQVHFNEDFQLLLPDDLKTLRKLNLSSDQSNSFDISSHDSTQEKLFPSSSNAWTCFDQGIVPLDSVKPLDKRKGWSAERIAEHNRHRFEDLVTAGWDLVIVDEAHRLGGSTEQVARYKLGRGLADAAPYLLLLSATPHQGKTDAFHRLVSLLDSKAFPDEESVSRDRVAPYVIRTEKKNAIDSKGGPLFKLRKTEMSKVVWEDRHELQRLLYDAVSDYVREGYNQALLDKKRHIGFLMVLMQRLVTSSTRAIRTTLERRLAALKSDQYSITIGLSDLDDAGIDDEDFYDMDSQELLDELLKSRVFALKNEVDHVKTLLDAAGQYEQVGPDAKAENLIELIYQLQADENDSDLKILIFTEFVPTQEMICEFLEARGISVARLNGSMSMEQRNTAQAFFRDKVRVLVSTDAGGEGLNLQFCHIIINYDIPWNPMRLEQRIGRVDRIGQPKTVRAINFIFQDSVECRVREVLEQKLAVIYAEFGIDKTGDVLDSAQAGEMFEDVFSAAILDPDSIESSVDETINIMKREIQEIQESSPVYGISEDPDMAAAERLRSHPLPHWIERMTTSYLNSHGGKAVKKQKWWELQWPDGEFNKKTVFSTKDNEKYKGVSLLNLENSKVRGLALNLSQIVSGQPLPCVRIKSLPEDLCGYWGLFEIRLQVSLKGKYKSLRIPQVRRRFLSVFSTDEGKVFLPTARHIWDAIYSVDLKIQDTLDQDKSESVFDQLMVLAEKSGLELFNELRDEHMNGVASEEERGQYFFTARQKAIEKIGLPEVRNFRLKNLDIEKGEWINELYSAKQVIPEIKPLLMLRILKGGNNE